MSTLTRPKEGRLVGGVCAGIARNMDLDVTLVRVIAAALVLFAGAGPLIYLVAWAIIPNEEDGSSFAADAAEQARKTWSNRKGPRHPQGPDQGTGPTDTFDPYSEN